MTDWSLVVCGDWAPTDNLEQAILSDPLGFYGDLIPVIMEADLAIVNLEGPFCDTNLLPIIKDGVSIKFSEALVEGLFSVPFHLACLANNHIFDYGEKGLRNTIDLLEKNKIDWIGAGFSVCEAEEFRTFHFGDTRLGILNVAEGEEGRAADGFPGVAGMDLERVRLNITAHREQFDLIGIIVHAGRENLPIPCPYIREAFHCMVDAGADFIIGHHPHVSQGIEYYRSVPIIYSLGNFAMWMGTTMPQHYLGYMVKLNFQGHERIGLETWPYQITTQGLVLLKNAEFEAFQLHHNQLNDLLNDGDKLDDLWKAYADRWIVKEGIQDLLENSVRMADERYTLAAILKSFQNHSHFRGPLARLLRSFIWRMINQLERHASLKLEPKAAAIIRNRFDTPAHRELYLFALARLMRSEYGNAAAWAYDLLDQWQVLEA
jgi:hypothetical protein